MGLPEQLTAVAKAMGCRYTIKGEPIPYEQVFSPSGLLPPILRRADQLCSFCLGYGLGLTFERIETAKTGVVVQFDSTTPNILRLVCAADVLNEFMQHAPSHDVVPLDDLMLD
jgi:intracellular multiplication protein IcmS